MKAVEQTHRVESRATRNGAANGAVLPPDVLRQLSGLLRSQCKQYRKKLRRCQKKFSEEAVHDSRVEARRLISVVELLGAFLLAARIKKIERLLKQHLDTFDELRDTQVQLASLRKIERSFPAARIFKAYLKKREERLTRETRKCVKRLKTGRAGKLVEACRQRVEAARKRCPPDAAGRLLLAAVERAFARTEQLKSRIDARDTKTIHCTRVAFKKFRYMMETLAEIVPSLTREQLCEMHDYQTLMGDVQDAEVLLQAFDKFLCKKELKDGSARKLQQALLRRRQDLIGKFLRSSNELKRFWPIGAGMAMPSRTHTGNRRAASTGKHAAVSAN
jgi:CHAD domain-containing protein